MFILYVFKFIFNKGKCICVCLDLILNNSLIFILMIWRKKYLGEKVIRLN